MQHGIKLLCMISAGLLILQYCTFCNSYLQYFFSTANTIAVSVLLISVITGRMPRNGKVPVLFLPRGQKSAFSPCRGDSLHRFMWNLARRRGMWVRFAVQIFTPVGAWVWECDPQNGENFHFLVKSRPIWAHPLSDFFYRNCYTSVCALC